MNLFLADASGVVVGFVGGLCAGAALFWFWPKIKRGFNKHRPGD